MAVKGFFKWLAGQPGYKSRIRYSDADYFNSSANDERIAKAVRERPVPTLDQILHVLRSMPVATVLERRDRALVAFTLYPAKRRARQRYRLIETAACGFEGADGQPRCARSADQNPKDLHFRLLSGRR